MHCPKCGFEFKPPKLKCLRCDHTWYQRSPNGPPKVCPNPKCKSPYWDRPRREPLKSSSGIKGETVKA